MRSPNLLFLMADQQRANTLDARMACQTPNLVRLAAEGARFGRCYTVNPICSPARASLMTGLLPHTHGMVDVTHAVPEYRASFDAALPVWPRILQEAGYDTAYFGKWHVERSHRLENFGFYTYEVEQYQQKLGLVEVEEELSERRIVRQKGYGDFLLCGVSDRPPASFSEYQMYSDGIDFLRKAAAAPDRPWALFLSTEAPHDPYIAPRSIFQRYNLDDIDPPANFEDDLSGRPAIYRRIQSVWNNLSWDDFAVATACYYASCTMVDEQIGRILKVLDELGMAEDTIVIFTSDHGDYMAEHRLMLKGVPAFEGAYRIPLVIRGPGVPAGREISDVISLLDLVPTLMELTTGVRFPCHGRSLLPLLRDEAAGWQQEAFAECHGQRFNYTQRILWRGSDKYVFNGFDEDELYDLAADPHELNNLAGEPENKAFLESMATRMWEIMRETGDETMLGAQYGMFRYVPVGPLAAEGNLK